jgi:SAM-dependent methyltransferase
MYNGIGQNLKKHVTTTDKMYYCQICGTLIHRNVVYVVNGYPICKCESCGVGRVDVNDFDPRLYYDNGYFTGKYEHSYTDYIGSKEILSREFAKTLEFIRSVGPAKGNLLEVGCAYGLFLQQAQAYYDVHGVELVQEAATYCHARGLTNVKHGVLTKDDLEKLGVLDVAIMLDVIEHIDTVAETVEMIATHLRPGGSFIVTTGDWSSIVAKLTGSRWRLMAPPLHLWYFTPISLEKLGLRFGLEVISCSHPWKIVPLELILQQAKTMLGITSELHLPKSLKALGFPASLNDAMRIVFRKVA